MKTEFASADEYPLALTLIWRICTVPHVMHICIPLFQRTMASTKLSNTKYSGRRESSMGKEMRAAIGYGE